MDFKERTRVFGSLVLSRVWDWEQRKVERVLPTTKLGNG